ncbi:MAG: enoyl-CoA hydratase/isomerase family protein [Sphingomonas bacterium]
MTIEDRNAILLEKNGPIATITLNRPEKANAFRHGDYELLLEHIEDCEKDPAVRAVIVTGAGRSFSAGDDFEGYAGGPQEALTLNHPFYGALHHGDLLAAKSSGYRIPLQVLAETCMVSEKSTSAPSTGFAGRPKCSMPSISYFAPSMPLSLKAT